MLHTEMATATEILYIDDGCAGANGGGERDDQCILDGNEDLDRKKPFSIALHSSRQCACVIVRLEDIAISMSRYGPVVLDTQYDPGNYRETAV